MARKIASAFNKPQTQHNVVSHSTAATVPQKHVSPAISHSLNEFQAPGEKNKSSNGTVNHVNGEAAEQ